MDCFLLQGGTEPSSKIEALLLPFQLLQSHPWLSSPVISSIHPREERTDSILSFFPPPSALLVSPKLTEVGI